jgi:hypothetical protein
MSLDLNKLASKLDEALSNETSETLTKFLNDKRMTNNKQQTAVEDFYDKVWSHFSSKLSWSELEILNEFKQQAKEMEKQQILLIVEEVGKGIGVYLKDSAEIVYNRTYGGNK